MALRRAKDELESARKEARHLAEKNEALRERIAMLEADIATDRGVVGRVAAGASIAFVLIAGVAILILKACG